MNIGPVDNVRIAPVMRPRVSDLGLTDVDQIESTARSHDQTDRPIPAKAATGFEDENDAYEDTEEGSEEEREVQSPVQGNVSYFA